MKNYLLYTLLITAFCVNAQTTETYNIDWSFGSNPDAEGDANADRTIEVGDTVIWTWYADGFHNVVSDDDATETFESALMGPESTFSYTFTEVGTNGYVCTPHSGNMFGTITVVPDGSLNTEDFTALENFKIFPNPATDTFTISFEGQLSKRTDVKIYNTLGQKVRQIQVNSGINLDLDISNLNSGLYLVKIAQAENSVTKRLMIK